MVRPAAKVTLHRQPAWRGHQFLLHLGARLAARRLGRPSPGQPPAGARAAPICPACIAEAGCPQPQVTPMLSSICHANSLAMTPRPQHLPSVAPMGIDNTFIDLIDARIAELDRLTDATVAPSGDGARLKVLLAALRALRRSKLGKFGNA